MIDVTLNNDVKCPALGIGTFMMKPDQAQAAVAAALKDGYRLVDTANAYLNEKAVGRAVAASGIDRKDLFLATKLRPTVYRSADAVPKTLERLGTDYVDLLFIHQPAGDYTAGYRQLEQAYKEGKTRSIGISNFYGDKLKRLLDECEIKPQVIQLEAHPYCTEKDIVKNPHLIAEAI
ncbi:MAG: aldo/keto reductase [Clostridia bacterium]|nr:aldo/keto reductase [Clostridia bacterium]